MLAIRCCARFGLQGGVYDNLYKQADGSFGPRASPDYSQLEADTTALYPERYAQPDLYDAPALVSPGTDKAPLPKQLNIDGTDMYDNGDYRRRQSEPYFEMGLPPAKVDAEYGENAIPPPISTRPRYFEVNSLGKPSPWNTLKLGAEMAITPDTAQNTPDGSRRATPVLLPESNEGRDAPSPSYAAIASSPPSRRVCATRATRGPTRTRMRRKRPNLRRCSRRTSSNTQGPESPTTPSMGRSKTW